MSVEKSKPKSHFLILYGSETGQAKAISEEIADKAVQFGLNPARFCLSLTDKRFSIEKEKCVVFIVSTTGDGQPPDTAIKFFRRLNRNSLKPTFLENLNYALLALGDSNYLKFAAFGRQLEHRLKALSAKSFYPTGYGDDAFGIETGVDPWIDNLWPVLFEKLNLNFEKRNLVDSYSIHKINGNLSDLEMDASSQSDISNHVEDNSIISLPSILKKVDSNDCHVPKLPLPLYTVVYNSSSASNVTFCPSETTLVVPASPIVKASLISARQLTFGDDVKNTLELTFKFQDKIIDYEPGDSFGFICPNDEKEVNLLLNRLGILDMADIPANLVLHKECPANRKLPAHIPNLFTIKELLLHHIEIRAVPKKILLRIFAEFTENEEEKLCLLFLASQEGSNFFTEFVRKPSLSIIDILLRYKSCKPPVEKIIENLPPLKPRFYSVASSSLSNNETFNIIFNVLRMRKEEGRMLDREGVCTGWFQSLSLNFLDTSSDLSDKMSALKLDNLSKSVFVYKRKNQFFRFPSDLKIPIIMVGPGTGIAPFIGYLQHREKLLQTNSEENCNGETWLFFGCRYCERDYLYMKELQRLVENKVLHHLLVSFSRDSSSSETKPRYVQENIKLHAQDISDCIKSDGKIYVCGDAKHMVHDVQQAFIQAVQIGFDVSESEAKRHIEMLQKEHKYVNDVWA